MADDLYYKHGTSDEYIDPFCDICFETKGHNIKVHVYCKDCFQFLCTDCHVFHKHFKGTRNHTILQGMDMPQSQAEKPAQFEICGVHSKQVQDQFCSNHNVLLCLLCCSSGHKDCSVLSVEDKCKNICSSEITELFVDLNKYKQALDETESSIIKSMGELKKDKKKMLKEAQTIYDKILVKAAKLLHELKTDIQETSKSELSVLQKYQKQVQDISVKLNSSLSKMSQLKDKNIDAKVFLEVHDIVSFTKKGNAFSGTIHKITLLMEPNQLIKDFLSSSTSMGSISRADCKTTPGVILPEITFPALVTKGKTAKSPLSISAITSTKINTYKIQMSDDKKHCFIPGMAIMKSGNRILADRTNSRLKMFSPDMKMLSCLALSDEPWDVCVASDSDVIVSTSNSTLVFVSISNRQMSITKSHKLSFEITGIAKCGDKFVITSSQPYPASVKLLDAGGNVHWSLSHDKRGQPLFGDPRYVCHHTYGNSSTVIVSDLENSSLTLVTGETGEIMITHQLKTAASSPTGVTTDSEGNIYVCFWGTNEVAVLSGDLSKERILLSRPDGIAACPEAIAYDGRAHQILISYGGVFLGENKIDVYQLR